MSETERPDLYWFGRLDNKLDRIENKLDGHGEKLADHEARLTASERGLDDVRSTIKTETGARVNLRHMVSSAVVGALVSGGFVVLQIFTHH